MAALGVRNLAGFNRQVKDSAEKGSPIKDPLFMGGEDTEIEAPDLEALPVIVVVIDEFADMMMMVVKSRTANCENCAEGERLEFI